MNGSMPGVENSGGRRHAREQAAVAWVESPLQLLCAVEARHAGVTGPLRVLSRDRQAALRITRSELTGLGLPPGLELAAPRPRMPRPGRGTELVLGDAFSGQAQLTLLTSAPGRVVLVDDGLATIRLLELLTGRLGTPLLRARSEPGTARRLLGAAAGLRLRAGRLTVFTALPVPGTLRRAVRERGIELVAHDFAWLRSQPPGPGPSERTIVLGTSLVRNGLVHRERYLGWLRGLRSAEPIAYYPHRREDPADLAVIREYPGVTVHETGTPVEMTLRGLHPGQRVLSLPSTAVTSLRVLLSPRGVPVETVTVPEDWWTDSAAPGLRSHLQMFAHHDTGVTS